MKYYDGSYFELNEKNRFLVDIRKRSKGRTSFWVNKATRRALTNPEIHKFIYLRRQDSEMLEVINSGFASNLMRTEYYAKFYKKNNYSFSTESNKIFIVKHDQEGKEIEKIHVGYLRTLNKVKGLDLLDVDLIIFDEFVALKRSDYKGGMSGINEPMILNKMIHTVFRNKPNRWLVMLGNDDTPTNPYNEYFHIPYGVKSFTDKKRGLVYRYDPSEGETESVAAIFSSFDDKTYKSEVGGGITSAVPEYLIEQKPQQAEYLMAIKYANTFITFWSDIRNGVIFAHDNYKVDRSKPVYSAFFEDMSVDSSMLIGALYPQIKGLKLQYFANQIRYNNQSTAQKMLDIINIIR